MAFMEVDFYSEVLGLCCQANVILPQKKQGGGTAVSAHEGRYPVLWLFHGGSDDHTAWQRNTSIERYVEDMGLAVVMPAAQFSMYANMAHGGRYQDFVSEELPELMRSFFPLSDKREDNFIAGISMGGYGALRTGLAHPEKYSALGCFSCGNMTMMHALQDKIDLTDKHNLAFGDKIEGTENDLYFLAQNLIKSAKPLPRIYQACGTGDFLINVSRHCRDFFNDLPGAPFDYTYKEGPGEHSWEFWDLWIKDYLKWLRL